MPTPEQIKIAIEVINEVAGNPDSGAIADLVRDLKTSTTPTPEKRVIESKEIR